MLPLFGVVLRGRLEINVYDLDANNIHHGNHIPF